MSGYFWSHDGTYSHGPFISFDSAIADAIGELIDGDEFWVIPGASGSMPTGFKIASGMAVKLNKDDNAA